MKKTSTLFIACAFFAVSLCMAQFPTAYKKFGDHNSDLLLPTSDNAVLAFGGVQTNAIIKFDVAGNILWSRAYDFGNTGFDVSRFTDAVQCSDSSFAAVGTTPASATSSSSSTLGICTRFKRNGDVLWSYRFSNSVVSGIVPLSISQTSDSGFVVCGYAVSSGTNDPYHRGFISRLSKSGSLSWFKLFNTSYSVTRAATVKETSDSGFVCIGQEQIGNNSICCALLTKFTKTGNTVWHKQFCTANNQCVAGMDLSIEKNGFLALMGDPGLPNQPALIKTDTAGNISWSKKYSVSMSSGGFDNTPLYKSTLKTHKLAGNKNLIIMNSAGIGGSLLTDSLGNVQRETLPTMSRVDHVQFKDKSFMIIGNFRMDIITKTAATPNAGFIITDSLGSGSVPCYQQSNNVTTSTVSYVQSMSTHSVVSGATLTAMNPTVSPLQLSVENGCLDFGTGLSENTLLSAALYPNPSQGRLSIRSGVLKGKVLKFELYDLTGKKIMTKEFTMQNAAEEIDLDGLRESVYFYRLSMDNAAAMSGKLVIAH